MKLLVLTIYSFIVSVILYLSYMVLYWNMSFYFFDFLFPLTNWSLLFTGILVVVTGVEFASQGLGENDEKK